MVHPALPLMLAPPTVEILHFLDAPRCAHCLPQQPATSQQAALAPRPAHSARFLATLVLTTWALQWTHAVPQVVSMHLADASGPSAPCQAAPPATSQQAATHPEEPSTSRLALLLATPPTIGLEQARMSAAQMAVPSLSVAACHSAVHPHQCQQDM